MEKTKILLCEDDESLGMLLREYLQAKDYNVTLAPDGEAGYQLFTNEKFDLCILDVMMPKKDGFTLAQDIRKINCPTCRTYQMGKRYSNRLRRVLLEWKNIYPIRYIH